MIDGIFAGLGAALLQDLGYIFSRLAVKKGTSPWTLLVCTQVWMGTAALPLVLLLWNFRAWDQAWPLLAGSAFGSLGGQYFFFRAEKKIEANRRSSLMGLRILTIAIVMTVLGEEHLRAGQWTGVVLMIAGAAWMNRSAGKMQFGGMGMFGCALAFYAWSDRSVFQLVRLMADSGPLWLGALRAMAAVNFLLAGTAGMLGFGQIRNCNMRAALPFSASWFSKQLLLYVCFGLIGPVLGNVVLALRGPLALGLTAVRIKFGYLASPPEESSQRRRKLAASFVMAVAAAMVLLC